MNTNTSWHLVAGRPVEVTPATLTPDLKPRVWDREFTAPCPHGRDVTWLAGRSRDEFRSWVEPGCDCEPAGDAQGGLCLSAAPGGPSDGLGAVPGSPGGPGVDLGTQSVSGEDAA